VKDINRFVIFRPGSLGDALVIVPLLRELKSIYPQATIEFLSEQPRDTKNVNAKDVAMLISEIDKVVLYKTNDSWSKKITLLKSEIKFKPGDQLLYLCNERNSLWAVLRDFIFFKLAGVKSIAGMVETVWDIIKQPIQSERRRVWRLVASLEVVETERSLSGEIRADKDWAKVFWDRNNLNNCFVVVVCPGSKMQSKRWPVEYYKEVFRRVSVFSNVAFVLIGDERDLGIVDTLKDSIISAKVVSAVGCNLLQTSGIVALSEIYLGNDTGPMHLAALHGKPCVAIFSSRDQAGRWYPQGHENIVFRKEIDCQGCMRVQCFADPSPCLLEIKPDHVADECIQMIKKKTLPNSEL